MLFTDYQFDERLMSALESSGFVTPTPIQAEAIPVALAGRDLVGTAQTGTGKTAAFVLPILQKVMNTPLDQRRTCALILAPTRELVEQIIGVVRELGAHTNLRAIAVYGGMPMFKQTRALRGGIEIVVACPGRLLDHINRRNTDFRHLDFLVLDEADRMLDMGFLPSIEEIIGHLPEKRQTMLFSATFPSRLNDFVRKMLHKPERVEVDTAVAAQTVHHTLYHVKHSMKSELLITLLREISPQSDSVLIFTRTRLGANQLSSQMNNAGMQTDVLHAEKTQRARQDTLDQFRSGHLPYLVATDIAARGIDVSSISHVINYDLPTKADDYLHRIGRTGRMEREGQAISFMTRGEGRSLHDIERMLGKKMTVAELGGSGPREPREDPGTQHSKAARPAQHHSTKKTPPRGFGKTETAGKAPRGRSERDYDTPPSARRQHAGAPKFARNEHPRKPFQHDNVDSYSRNDKRPARQNNSAVEMPVARPQQEEKPVRSAKQKEFSRKLFGSEQQTAKPVERDRSERSSRSSRPRRNEERAEFAPSSRPPAGKKSHPPKQTFTGMASTAKKHRKNASNKRQSGEIPASPRPQRNKG